jgi:filamentous hemagglutinin
MFVANHKNVKRIAGGMKKGYYYYLDELHKDHLEVFDGRGNFSHVLDFDGYINERKSEQAYNQGRNIKNCL